MAADASIYSLVKPAPSPLETYGQALNLKTLMGQQKLQELQTTKAQRDLEQEDAVQKRLSNLAPGETVESALPDIDKIDYRAGMNVRSKLLDTKAKQATIAHSEAQTGDLNAGHIAGAMAAIAKGNGSDQSIQAAHDMMAPLVGAERANAVTQKLLSLPPEARLAYVTAQAGTHKVGQEALKLFFPAAHMQDSGGEIQPVTTSTIPGGPAAGSAVPGGVTIPKTVTPDAKLTNDRVVSEGEKNRAVTVRGQNMTDQRQRELNGILDGQSAEPPSPALVDAIGRHEIELKPPPTNARNPIMLQRYGKTLEAVKAKYPNWGADQFPTVKKVEASFAAGPDAKTIQSLSNATGHLDTYEKLALAMKNGDSQAVNAIVNKVREQFGSDAPTNPQAVAQFLSAEIVKAASGAAGGVSDREHMASVFANKSSPAQMVGAANTVREIMGQQFRSLEQKYKSGTYGRTDFPDKYLTLPEVRSAYERANKAHSEPAKPEANPGGLVATVKDNADFDKLKPGTEFIGPDGVNRRKP